MRVCVLMQSPVLTVAAGTQDTDQLQHLLPESQRYEVGALSPEGKHTHRRGIVAHAEKIHARVLSMSPPIMSKLKLNETCNCKDDLQNICENLQQIL